MVRKSGNNVTGPRAGLVVVLLLLGTIATAQVRSSLSESRIESGGRITYSIQIDHEDPNDVVLPEISFETFDVVAGPSVRPASRASSEQRRRIVEIELDLRATVPGRHVLEPIQIQVAGQLYKTPRRLVEVSVAGDPERIPFLARWSVPDSPLVVGESRAVTLEIYNAAQFIYPSRIVVSPPERAIFEEVQGLGRNGQTVVDGVALYQIPVAVFMVTPSAAGEVNLDSASVEWEGLVATAPAVSIAVLDTPGDVLASGAVGTFELSASVSDATIAATESMDFTMRVEGVGNLHFLKLPDVTLDGLMIDSETRIERFAPGQQGYTGFLEERFVLRPTGPGSGRVTIDQFVHFDPERKRVVRTQIPGFDIAITAVKEAGGVDLTDDGLVLLDEEEIADVQPGNWYRNPTTYGLFVPGFLVLLISRIWNRKASRAAAVSCLFVFLVGAASTGLPWTAIRNALDLYDSGEVASSIHAFESASRSAPDSPGIQHNLAVLYFQAGDIGRSVYAAREAVRFNPGSTRIRNTVQTIEGAAGLDRSVRPAQVVHPDTLYIALVIAVNLFIASLAFSARRVRKRSGFLVIGRILIAAVAISLAAGTFFAHRSQAAQTGVILDEISLRRIPSRTAESWLDLQPGTSVGVVTQDEGFVLVRTALDLEGWVPIEKLLWPGNPGISVLRYRSFVL